MPKACTHPDCGRPLLSKGLCQTHYQQQRRGEELRSIKPQTKPKTAAPCQFDGCEHWGFYGGLCWSHHEQTRRGEEPRPLRPTGMPSGVACQAPNCERLSIAKGMCSPHRKQFLKGRLRDVIRGQYDECRFDGCDRPVVSLGYCQAHYAQSHRGQELQPIHVPVYRYVQDGYVLLREPWHANANKNGLVFEHVKVMARRIGRPITKRETVHHRNGVHDDNRPENLELWASRHPKGQRVEDLLAFAREIIADYADLEVVERVS